jgi:hypothetical protein
MNRLLSINSDHQPDGGSFPRSARRTEVEDKGEVGFVPARNPVDCLGVFTGSRGRQSALISHGRSLRRLTSAATLAFAMLGLASLGFAKDFTVLEPTAICWLHYVDRFNSDGGRKRHQLCAPTPASKDWLRKRTFPFFECPDREVEEMYYFAGGRSANIWCRPWTALCFTEFLTPMKHAAANTISCAAGFIIAEGRWLHDQNYLDDYVAYSGFAARTARPATAFSQVQQLVGRGAFTTVIWSWRPADFRQPACSTIWCARLPGQWEQERWLTNGRVLAIRRPRRHGGVHQRLAHQPKSAPTINSYMFANARAIAGHRRLAAGQ